ncbi:MAG: peptide deformylase [Phycisphaerales bacterium]|nr:MAG: peptide deformylase [Phycisphaerales bacterium]
MVQDLHIVHYPAEVLRAKAEPIAEVTDEVRQVATRMIELMREAEGIGLAAPQVGLAWRLFVADVPPDPDAPRHPLTGTAGPIVCINPELTFPPRAGTEAMDEGCLSLPSLTGEVLRPPTVRMRALDAKGEAYEIEAGGLLARCIQHETDHLDGVLILDKFTMRSRLKNRSAIRDLERGR